MPWKFLSTPIFPKLEGVQIKSVWSMIMAGARDFSVHYEILSFDETHVRVSWTALNRFSATNRPVKNQVMTELMLSSPTPGGNEGKILSQSDVFDFYRWARQALGMPGTLLGWMPWFQKQIQTKSSEKLASFRIK
jgi:hypothetical protein